jgi:hypothetical protein
VPVAVDEPGDLAAPVGHGSYVAAVARSGEPTRQAERRPRVDAAQEDVEGPAEAFGLVGVELRGEQGPQRDRGGEREHLLHQVDAVAVAPVAEGRRDLPVHDARVAAQVLVPEGGLHDQALAPVVLVRGRGQAVAHRRPHPRVPEARPVEAAEIGQHPAGQVRVAQHEGRAGAEPDLHQIPVSGQRIEQLYRSP